MSAPTLKELVGAIPPGRWGAANTGNVEDDFVTRPDGSWVAIVPQKPERQLIARIASPETAAKVYEALETLRNYAKSCGNFGYVKIADEALRLLDGTDAKTL